MNKNLLKSPRTIAVQMLYSYSINPDQKIIYNKNQFKKFIKDVVNGTIERKEFIDETIENYLKDLRWSKHRLKTNCINRI